MAANLEFTHNEFCTINDADFLRNKNSALVKVEHALGQLYDEMLFFEVNSKLPNTGKISRGENYLGLPYRVLDYPRLFDKNNICAVRTMFYWANFFSCTLIAGGQYLIKDIDTINQIAEQLCLPLYFCIHTNAWHHHFNSDNYILWSETTSAFFNKQIQNGFIKIAVKAPLSNFEIVAADAVKLSLSASKLMSQ